MKRSDLKKLNTYFPSQDSSKLVKIGEASKLLGVSIDTLRRWEKKGWLRTVKTPGGTRLYDRDQLTKLNPNLKRGPKSLLTPIAPVISKIVESRNNEESTEAINSSFSQPQAQNQFNINTAQSISNLPQITLSTDKQSLREGDLSSMLVTLDSLSESELESEIKDAASSDNQILSSLRTPLTILKSSLIAGVITTLLITLLVVPAILLTNYIKNTQTASVLSDKYYNIPLVGSSEIVKTLANIFTPTLSHRFLGGYQAGSPPGRFANKNLTIHDQLASGRVSGDLKGLIFTGSKGQVLAAESSASGKFLQINVDTELNGNLAVDGEGFFTGNITAPNILYGVVAGNNIQITGDAQNPTISANITSTETLQSVTARGATTTIASTFSGGLTTSSINLTGALNLGQLASDPGTGVNGATYYNTGTNKFRCYISGSWSNCDTDTTSAGDITAVNVGNGLSGGGDSDDVTIDLDVETTGTTTTTSSNSGLETASDGLSLLRGCTNSQSLVWDSTAQEWECGSPSGLTAVEESDVDVGDINTLDFLGGDFDISISPANEGNIQLASVLTSVTGVAASFDVATSLTVGTANATTITSSGEIQLPSTETLQIGTIELNDGGGLAQGVTSTTSGAVLVGVFNGNFANAASATNVQEALDAFDNAIGGGASKWTSGVGFTYLTDTTSDLVIGDSTVAGASLFFDESASNLYLGTNESANGILTLYSSGAGITDASITTDASGNLIITSANFNTTSTGINNTAIGQTTAAAGTFTTLTATGNVTLNDAGADNILIGAAADTVTITSNSLSLTDDNWSVNTSGAATFASVDAGSGTIQTTGSVFGNAFDRSSAGALTIGNTNATSISLCNSAACDTISIGTNADADSITIGDATDSFTLASSGLNVSSAGALSGITTIVTSGTINTATISGGTLSGGTFSGGSVSGGTLTGTALSGTGSFTITGGTGASETLTLVSTSNGTKGDIQFFSSANKITSAGAMTIAGSLTSAGLVSSGTNRFTTLSNGVAIVTSGNGTIDSEAQLALARGGTNKNLTPVAGGIVYTDADSLEVTSSAGTSGQCLKSAAGGEPTWGSCVTAAETPFGTSGGVITKSTAGDYLSLRYGDAADTQLEIENTTTSTIPTADSMVINLTGGTTGIVTDGADGLYINTEFGDEGTAQVNSALHLDVDPVAIAGGSDDTFYALNIDGLSAGTSATETAIKIGSNWDNVLDSANLDISGAGAISGATGISSSGTIAFSGLSTNGVVIATGGTGTLSTESQLALSRGGTNKNLTPVAGGILYTDADSAEVSSAGTAGQAVLSGGTGSPTFTTGTLSLASNFAVSGANAITLTGTSGGSSVTIPTSGTLITNTASANQTITSTQTTGTVFSIADSTALTGAITGQSISLTGSNAQDQTGLRITLSGASGSNLNALVVSDGTNDTAKLSKSGSLTLGTASAVSSAIIMANANHAFTTTFQTSDSQAQNNTFTLPVNDGSSNNVLITDGSGVLSWASVSGIGAGGDITAVGDITTGDAFTETAGNDGNNLWFEGSSSDTNEIKLTAADPGSDLTVTLPAITGTLASLAGTQTFTGAKSFTGGVTLGIASSNTGSLTFAHASHAFTNIFQSSGSQTQSNTYTLPVDDGSSNYVLATDGNGILSWQSVSGVGAGTGDITSVGSMVTGDVFADASADDDWLGLGGSAGRIEFDDQTIDEVNILAANVGIGTSTPTSPLNVNNTTFTVTADASQAVVDISGALTEAGSGTHARLVGVSITAPTITAGAGAVTNTASLYVAGAPSASGATNYSIWVDAGNVRFDGLVIAGSGSEALTVASGKIDADAIGLISATNDASSTTSSASGLESISDTLALLQGCSDTDTLAWDEDNDVWACSTPTTAVVTISEGAVQYTNQNELQFNEYDFGVQDSGATSIITADFTNFGSRATPFNLGDALAGGSNGDARRIDIGGVDNDFTNTINISTNSTSADVLTIGNSNSSTTLALTGGDDWSITTAGLATFAANVNANGGLDVDDAFVIADGGVLTTSQAANFNAGLDIDDVFVIADGGAVTANTDVNFVFAGAEDFAITSDLATAGTLNVQSIVGTPSSTNGTIRGLLVQQASSANTNGLDTGILIDNADDGLAITDAIKITSSGGGAFTNFLETPSIDISGAGVISGATGITSSGTITFSGLSTAGVVVNNASGVLSTTAQLSALRGGTGLDTSASTGVPSISGGTWSVNTVLPLSLGGTNKNLTPVAGGIVYTDADSLEVTAAGTLGQCFVSNGSSAPAWDDCDSSATTPFTTSGGIIDKTTVGDRLRLLYGDAGDVQFTIENTTNATIPSADAMQIDLTGGTTGIITDGADGLFIATEFGNGTTNTNSGLHLDINPVNTPSGDEVFNGILIDALAAGTAASENAIQIGANWDKFLDTPSIDISGTGAITGATGISSSGTIAFGGLTTNGPVYTSGGNGTLNSEAQLAITRGGTNGTATPTAGALAYGTGSAYAFSSAGTSGQAVLSGGSGSPTFTTGTLALAGNFATAGTSALTLTTSATTNATFPSGTITLADLESTQTFTGAKTFNTTTTLTYAGTENLSITSDLAGDVNVISLIGTPSSTTGTTRGFAISQADSSNSNGLDTGFYINNLDTDLAIGTAIQIANTGGGGYTNLLDTASIDITGAGAITGATGFNGLVITANNGTITTGTWNGSAINVAYGGTGATTLTSNGVLYGNGTSAIGATSAGTDGQLLLGVTSGAPAFATMSSDATITNAGVLTIAANAVALTTDTTGNYVASITNGSGISGGNGGSEGAALTLALSSLTADWNQTGAFDIILNNASSELQILESAGATFYGTLDIGDLTANRTYTFPDATGTVCLTTGNCTGVGGEVTGSGVAGEVAFFTDADSISSDNGFKFDSTNDVLGLGLGAVSADTSAQLDFFGESEFLQLRPADIASDADTNNSPTLRLRGTYDSDVATGPFTSSNYNFDIRNTMTAAGASPASRLGFINNAGTELLSILSSGNVGINDSTPSYYLDVYNPTITANNAGAFRSESTMTNHAASTYTANSLAGTIDLSTNNTSAATYVGNYLYYQTASDSITYNSSTELRGTFAAAQHLGSSTFGGLTALYAEAANAGAGATSLTGVYSLVNNIGSGTTTTAYGVRVEIGNNPTITNTYGVHVGDVTSGTQTNTAYSFYASDSNAHNYFAGRVGIGSDITPNAPLAVGDGTDELQVSSVGDITFVDADGTANITGPAGAGLTITVPGNADADDLTLSTTGSAGDIALSSVDAITLTAAGTMTFEDGAGNDYFTIVDNGTSGTLAFTNTGFLDLSAVTHASSALQGLRLPQNTSLTNPSSGEGFLAWDSDDNLIKVFDGSSWVNISGASTNLQNAYDNGSAGDQTISLSSTNDSVIISNPSSNGSNSGTAAFRINQLSTGSTISQTISSSGTGTILDILSAQTSGTGTRTNGISIDQSGTGTLTNGINITNSAGTLTNGLTIGSGSQAITTGINLASTGITTDISLQNGETIDNDTDGTLNFAVSATSALKIGSTGISSIGNVAHSIVNSAGALNIDSNSTGAINIGTSANAKTITIGNATGASALAFTSGTGSQTFTSSVATTATTSSAWVFTGNSLSSGTGMYASSTSLTTGKLAQFSLPQNNFSSGTIMDLRTTSTGLTGAAGTGSLLNLDWSPGSTTTATGDLFSLNIGSNGSTTGSLFNILDSGSSIFSVKETDFTTSLPANFTAAGDVSVAYDINFTNPTVSYIKSTAPIAIYAGEVFNSSNLNLGTYNQGSIVFDTANTTTTALDFTNGTLTTGIGFNMTLAAVTTGNALSINTTNNTLTTGTLLNVSSSSTAVTTAGLIGATLSGNPAASWTGAAGLFEITGNDADIDGSALKVGVTASSTAGSASTALNVTSAGPSGSFVVRFNDDGTYTDSTPFVVAETGNVGIGDSTPTEAELVIGSAGAGNAFLTLSTTGTTNDAVCWDASGATLLYDCDSTPADYAESYPVEIGITFGEIVMTGDSEVITNIGTTVSKLVKATANQSSKIIGITSDNYHDFTSAGKDEINPADNPMPVALNGRVLVKISQSSPTIKKGDFITVSDEPGKGTKATQPGMMVGKALEDWNPGKAAVMVFVATAFADPNNALANLLVGDDGSLLGSNIQADKITVSGDTQIGGLASANDFGIAEGNINRTGALANLPVSAVNTISLADIVNTLNDQTTSQAQTLSDLQNQIDSNSVELAQAKILGEQAVSHAQSLDEKVASTSANLSSLSDRISDLLASISTSSPKATDSAINDEPITTNDLTPPDVMFATGSATLANLDVSEKISTLNLSALDATVSATFKSLGDTFLGNTVVAGDFSIDGTLSLTGNSINSIACSNNETMEQCNNGVLMIQNSPLASTVDFFNGLVTIAKDGVLTAKEIVVDQIKVTANKSAGTVTIPAGEIEIPVLNDLVKSDSIIILTSETPGAPALAISAKVENSGFIVTMNLPFIEDVQFSYLIVGVKEASN